MSMTLKTLLSIVKDEETAIEFLQNSNIIPRTKICENGHQMKIRESNLWRCSEKSCSIVAGIKKGTWLDSCKISFQDLVLFIYFWSHELSSLALCEYELNMNRATTLDWNDYLRDVCAFRLEQSDSTIGGEGMTVEVAESVFVHEQRVFAGICRETKECFMVRVPDRSIETLLPIVKEKIKPGSTVASSLGFERETIEGLHFVERFTQLVGHMLISAKLSSKKRARMEADSIDSYLAEFMWRMQLNGRDPFQAILEDISLFWSAQT